MKGATVQDEKYVVFKRDDWENFKRDTIFDYHPQATYGEPDPIEDATVLRPNDIFTAPTLHAYVGAVTTAIEIYERVLDIAAPAQLAEARDYFMNRAEEADHTGSRRFPD